MSTTFSDIVGGALPPTVLLLTVLTETKLKAPRKSNKITITTTIITINNANPDLFMLS